MLSEDKIIALYSIVGDMPKGLHHYKDARVQFSDAEVLLSGRIRQRDLR